MERTHVAYEKLRAYMAEMLVKGLGFPEETADVAARLKVRRLVPVHWGAYPMALHSWNDPILRLIPKVRELGIVTLTPKLGQVFDADTETEAWYLEPSLNPQQTGQP